MKHNQISFFILLASFVFWTKNCNAQTMSSGFQPDSIAAYRWADSVLNTLSPKEKLGQMLMVRVYSNKTENEYAAVDKLIEECHVGGVLFFQGTVREQAQLTGRWQSKSKIPLFVTIDGETGLGMRLNDAAKFPAAVTMGAVTDDQIIFDAGEEIGKQCRNLGIQINYAPVADVNINPKNPVIGVRSFGENPENVARKVTAYAKGMQNQGVMAVAKHFPGHGDTETDSHYALPVINHSRERLEKTELYPFRYAVKEGINGIMLGHLNIPALDTLQKPSSLSYEVGTRLLQNEIGFGGLIMTDGLDMSGVTSYTRPGVIEVEAFLAGNDILLLPPKPRIALDSLVKAYESNIISQEELDKRCRKILFYKALYGLGKYDAITTEKIDYVLHPSDRAIRRIYDAAATVLTNSNDAIPLNLRAIDKTLVITYGKDKGNFEQSLTNFGPFSFVSYEEGIKEKNLLDKAEIVLAVVFAGGRSEGTYGIAQSHINHIRTIAQKKKVILVLFANPYALRLFEHPNVQGLVMGYENQPLSTASIPEILTGVLPALGTLPVSAGDFKSGDGIRIEQQATLRMVTPDELNINRKHLSVIDSLAWCGIKEKAYPGCQILLAKDGKVFYNKSFGNFSYTGNQAVSNENLYDIASLTKILGTTPAVMKLEEQGKIDIDRTLGHYLRYLKGTDKENLVIRDILAHQSGLSAWIPFYARIDTSQGAYSSKQSEQYPVCIADDFYMCPDYIDSIYNRIADSKLKDKKYRYSDLGMILLADVVKRQSGMALDEFLEKEIYRKMNLATLGFNPLDRFPNEKIIPTENDTIWRKQLLQGHVHDMAAAMFGGITGNAGLFSNAWDVAAMMQMYLQNGYYNGQLILKQSLVREYTKQQFPLNDNRRGLGFDKPHTDKKKSPVCDAASKSSFGHSGFTGCFAWADPSNGLVYVFLSNRIHPSSENNKLSQMNLRSLIHSAAYEAIFPVKK